MVKSKGSDRNPCVEFDEEDRTKDRNERVDTSACSYSIERSSSKTPSGVVGAS